MTIGIAAVVVTFATLGAAFIAGWPMRDRAIRTRAWVFAFAWLGLALMTWMLTAGADFR